MRTQGPIAVTMISGFVMLISFYFGALTGLEKTLYSWSVIVAGFAAILGIGNLTRIYARKISRGQDTFLSATALAVMWGILLYGIFKGQQDAIYRQLFDAMYTPVGTTTMSLLAFFIASAAARAFRPRSVEASIMLVCSLITILGRAPAGALIWQGLPQAADWLQAVPSNAGARGILLGAALGALSMSIRVMVGIERRHFGTGSES